MYAISHAVTALAIRRRWPEVPLWPLLIGAQAVELVWIALTLAGVEHFSVHNHRVSLDFLPYSHSVASGLGLALAISAALRVITRDGKLALAVGIAIVSHIALDILQHEPDIFLLPAALGPRLGTGLLDLPWLNLVVELGLGVACWRLNRGGFALLAGIVVFNLANIPTMWQWPAVTSLVVAHPVSLPLLIGAQILATWLFVAWAAKPRRTSLNPTVMASA